MRVPPAKIYFPEKDRKKILEQVDEILESGQLTLGKYTREFEEQFAKYVGTKYTVAVNSGDQCLRDTNDIEEHLLAHKKGFRLMEVPTVMRHRESGSTKCYPLRELLVFPLDLIRTFVRNL